VTSPGAIFLVFAMLTAFVVGYRAPGLPDAPMALTRFPRTGTAQIPTRPNDTAGAALADLRIDLAARAGVYGGPISNVEGDPPPPAPPEAVEAPPPPPPPPPDVAMVFRRRLTAVVDQGPAGLAVLLSDPSAEGRATRLLRPGEVFEGRWRLAALTSSEATLRDGRQSRRVPFYDAVGAPGS